MTRNRLKIIFISQPNSWPSQNLPYELDCSKFFKCHNGYLLLIPCPRGWNFHTQLSTCIPFTVNECSEILTTSTLLPTPSIITTTSNVEIPTAPVVTDDNSETTQDPSSTNPTPPLVISTDFTMPTPPTIKWRRKIAWNVEIKISFTK